ncbi:MAG TPA: DUF2721 domain-containing protein [Gemmatimonadales bacterium]
MTRRKRITCHHQEGSLIQELQVSAIAHVIQLAVAPVFLLTGVGAMLGVMANRLGRVIDRARVLEERLPAAPPDAAPDYRNQLGVLGRRSHLIQWAIGLCTASALLVCAVIVTLFVGAFLKTDVAGVIGAMFVAAMLSLSAGLILFLAEIRLAIGGIRIGPR